MSYLKELGEMRNPHVSPASFSRRPRLRPAQGESTRPMEISRAGAGHSPTCSACSNPLSVTGAGEARPLAWAGLNVRSQSRLDTGANAQFP